MYDELVKKELMPLTLVNLLKKTDHDNKISDFEDKISSITGLATTTALTAVKNAKSDIDEIYSKINSNNLYITLNDYNKFTKDIFDAKTKKEKLINKSSLYEKIKTLATKEEIKTLAAKGKLKSEQDKIVKLQAHDLSYFLGKFFLVMMVHKICLFINLHLVC